MELSEQNFGVSYTVTLAPGVVRYLKIQDFLQSDFEEALIRLRSLSKILEIESPEYVIYPASFGKAFTARFAKENERWNATRLDSAEYDNLLKNESWEERLRSHHKLGRLFLTEALPTSVYCSFFEFFRLKEHAFEECLNSWVKNALENDDIINSYRKSEEHFVVSHCVRDCELEFIFSKTPYVKARLDFLAQNEIERKAVLDLVLRSIYHECDLLITKALSAGVFEDLEPAELAGLLSCFVFESKRSSRGANAAQQVSTKKKRVHHDRLGQERRESISERLREITFIAATVRGVEERYKVPHFKEPDGHFATIIAAWARGVTLGTVLDLADAEIGQTSPGDFVRNAKQVADLCEQLARMRHLTNVADVALAARDAVLRSVVAGASSVHPRA